MKKQKKNYGYHRLCNPVAWFDLDDWSVALDDFYFVKG